MIQHVSLPLERYSDNTWAAKHMRYVETRVDGYLITVKSYSTCLASVTLLLGVASVLEHMPPLLRRR
jgi:hypothetical protein